MKVLCFGDNTSSEAIADKLARQFASSKNLPFRGLYSKESKELLDGCYHSSIYELSTHHFIENRKKFDKYIFLDQDQEQYSHTALFQQMFNLINAHSFDDLLKVFFFWIFHQNGAQMVSKTSLRAHPFVT